MAKNDDFAWSLQGKIMVIDNGCTLTAAEMLLDLMQMNAFAVVALDPSTAYEKDLDWDAYSDLQRIAGMTLGDGTPTKQYACLSAKASSSLKPLNRYWLPKETRQESQVLAQVPMPTLALDDIPDMPTIDWLILDDKHDNVSIFEGGKTRIADALVLQVRVPFQPCYANQSEFSSILEKATELGFRFHTFVNQRHHSHLPDDDDMPKNLASELVYADAVFVATDTRLNDLSNNRLKKLSFLMHSIYKAHDFSYSVLQRVDSVKAQEYLRVQGYLWPEDEAVEFSITHETSPDTLA